MLTPQIITHGQRQRMYEGVSHSEQLTGVTALVLAGGAGRRSGGRDKGLLQWQGERLVDTVCRRLQTQADTLLISCNRNSEKYAELARVIHDIRPDYPGPLAGLESAIGAVDTPWLLVCPCDTPSIPSDLGKRLYYAMASHGDPALQVAYAADDDGAHYLCALLRTSALNSLPGFLDRGGRAVREWYTEIGALAVPFPDSRGDFSNLNNNP